MDKINGVPYVRLLTGPAVGAERYAHTLKLKDLPSVVALSGFLNMGGCDAWLNVHQWVHEGDYNYHRVGINALERDKGSFDHLNILLDSHSGNSSGGLLLPYDETRERSFEVRKLSLPGDIETRKKYILVPKKRIFRPKPSDIHLTLISSKDLPISS